MTEFIETFFLENILVASRDAAVLAMAIALVSFVFAKHIPAFWKHGLWLLVALRLVIPVLPDSPFSWKNWDVIESETRPAREVLTPRPQPQKGQIHRREPSDSTGLSQAPDPVGSSTQPSLVTPRKKLSSIVAWCWFLVAAAVLILSVVRGFLFRQKIRRFSSAKVDDHLSALLEEAAAECPALVAKSAPTVRVTDAVTSPALSGIFRPEILLPSGLIEDISDRDLRHILLHEMAHHRRRDVWVNWLLTVLQGVHWFNPLVWWAFHRTRIEAERATDAAVLRGIGESERIAYGDALIRLLERISSGQRPESRIPGVVESHRGLKERISLIGSFSGKRRIGVTIFSVLLLAGFAVVGLTDPKSDGEADKEKKDELKTGENEEEQVAEWEIEVRDVKGVSVPVERLGKFYVLKKGQRNSAQFSAEQIKVRRENSEGATQQLFYQNLPDAEPGVAVTCVVIPTQNRPPLFAEGAFPNKGVRKLILQSSEELLSPESRILDSLPGYAPADLAGRVVDQNGAPVSGAEVSADWRWPFEDWKAKTDENGVFRLANFFEKSIWPGVGIKVEKEGLEVSWIVDIPVGKPFEVSLGRLNSRFHGKLQTEEAGKIQFVKNKASRFEKIRFTAQGLQHEAEIGADGSFDVAIEPGLYDIRIKTKSEMFAELKEIRLRANQSKLLSPILRPGAELQVTATDIETGSPVSGVSFYFEEATAPYNIRIQEGSIRKTDENGVAKWERLPIGENVFNLRRGEWMRMSSSDEIVSWPREMRGIWNEGLDRLHLDLRSGSNRFAVRLERGVAVKGIVLKPDGTLLQQARIHLSDSSGSTMTGDDRFGMWSSTGDGKLTVTSTYGPKKVFPKGHFQGWIPSTRGEQGIGLTARDFGGKFNDQRTAVLQKERWAEAVSELFTCQPGDEVEFTLQLRKGGWAIGRVVDEAGAPIPNIEVQARNQDRRSDAYANPTVLTNEKGEFRFDVLRKGKYLFFPDTRWGSNLGKGIFTSQKKVFRISEGKQTSIGDLVFAGQVPEPDPGFVRLEVTANSASNSSDSEASGKPEIRLARVVEEGSPDAAKAKRMIFANGDGKRSALIDQKPVITQDDIEGAELLEGRNNAGVSIKVDIKKSGRDRLQKATESLIGKPIAIIVEGKLISAPVVREPFSIGFQITGNFSRAEAERLVAALTGEKE